MVSNRCSEPLVRPVRPDELDRLADIDAAVFGELAYPFFVLRQHFDAHPENFLVVEHQRDLHGYALTVRSSGRDGLGWGLGLAVSAQSRGRGYGRLLMLESLTLLRRQGVREVRLTVEPDNAVAIRLYEQVGFRAHEEILGDHLGPGQDRLLMELRFPEGASWAVATSLATEPIGIATPGRSTFTRGVRELGSVARRPPIGR